MQDLKSLRDSRVGIKILRKEYDIKFDSIGLVDLLVEINKLQIIINFSII